MRHAGERGQTLPFVAIAAVLIMAFVGLAIDVGYLLYQQRLQQTAADAGAYAAAQQLISKSADITNAAQNATAANGYTNDGTNVIVTATSPPGAVSGDPYNGNAGAVEVLVKKNQPTFFMRVLGFTTVPVTTRAVGLISASDNQCLDSLSPTSGTNLNNATVNAPNCSLNFNDGPQTNLKANITAKGIGCVQNCVANGTYPEATPGPIAAVIDPCPQIPGCASLTSSPPVISGCTSVSSSATTLNPGCYNGGTFATNVTLNPGMYIINGNLNATKITLTGSGVTLYVTSIGNVTFNKSTVTLSACTTTLTPNIACANGAVNNIVIYQVAANTSGLNFNMGSQSLVGVVYMPTALSVNFNKSGSGYAVFIVGQANFNGCTCNFPGPAAGQSFIDKAVLAE